jgi:hypothetical protein
MQWINVASNQTVSWDSLKNACDNGVFLKLLDIPPSGVPEGRCVTAGLIQSYVEIQSAPLSGVPSNELVVKDQLQAVVYTYYQLTSCDGAAPAWTRLNPNAGYGQQYIIPTSGAKYWYNGTNQGPQTNIPSGYNGSIQRVDTMPPTLFCA